MHIPPNRLDSSPRTIWRPYGAGIHTFCNFLGCFWVKIGHFGHFWLTLEFRRVHHPRRQRVSLDPSKTSQNTPLRSQGVIGIRKSDIWLPKKALTLLQNMKTNRGWINRPIEYASVSTPAPIAVVYRVKMDPRREPSLIGLNVRWSQFRSSSILVVSSDP